MRLSFITVTYNSSIDIIALLQSLKVFLESNDEIIIVDNASADSTLEVVNAWKGETTVPHQIKVIANKENLGFGHACNCGALEAQGDYLIFINPDCILPPQDLRTWINKKYLPTIGVLAPLIRYPDGKTQPNQGGTASLATYVLQFLRVGAWLRERNLLERLRQSPFLVRILSLNASVRGFLSNFGGEPQARHVDWVSGAFMVVATTKFNEVKGFDQDFFLYCEDEDLCRRLRAKGYEIRFDPEIEVIHKVEGSKSPQGFSKGQLERLCSNIIYLRKWNGKLPAMVLNMFYVIAFVLRACLEILLLRFANAEASLRYICELSPRRTFRCLQY